MRGRLSLLPGEVSRTREEITERGRNKVRREKSAEAIVPGFFFREGPNFGSFSNERKVRLC